ncbi:MAG TPA: TonB-dependent receptor [Pyrinomonadaceae bacterium]
MKTPIRILTVLALALSFLVSASAQTTTTGSIEGTVVDVNGAAIPGITVSVSGPNLIRTQTATTNDDGYFNLPQIPPGRYTLTIESAKGFARFEQADVEVNLTRVSSLSVSLRPQGATETVEVTASSGAAVDVSTNTTGTNVSTEQFSNFPTQRTVQSLYTIAPTVTRSGLRDASGRDRDPSVAGSSGPENNYILDGVTVSDPAFGGSGANLPFEFVQEVQVLTGAYGADIGKSTGGVFNVITKSGSNDIRGDVFAYFTAKSFVREVKTSAIPFTGAAPNGFSEVDAGADVGGPIVKDKLWFFAAFNPQFRKNYSLTQTFLTEVNNEVKTPFYAGKITWGPSINHTINLSTFGDFTTQEGHLFGFSGFGADPRSFRGKIETGGSNYAARVNSTFSPSFIGEFSGGLHFQRANTLPELADQTLVTDRFAVLRGGSIVTPIETTSIASNGLRLAYVDGSGGTIQRNFVRGGFGLQSTQDRDRYEAAARLQNILGKHTLKYGFEFNQNRYNIDTRSTGPNLNFGAAGVPPGPYRIENRFAVCQRVGSRVDCPDDTRTARVQQLITDGALAGTGITSAATNTAIRSSNFTTLANPFLLLDVVRARDFSLNTQGEFTKTNVESFYIQDDFKATRNLQFNLGLRWDYQQAYSLDGVSYLKLNDFIANLQPRLGMIWDFTGQGRGKVYANFARFVETPLPLDLNARASGGEIQNDYNLNVSRLNGATGGIVTGGNLGNLGNHATPIDVGLSPQTVDEYTAGIEYEVVKDLALGFRGIYRAQDNVIEDGSFDDGENYFLFNPGRRVAQNVTTEDLACNDPAIGCFGPARRYYRALEFSATKRFTNNWQFIGSYVYSSLIGNYEGLFRNDNGQSDPNITSLFDLVSLLNGTYGRLPNDRPHQLKFDGSYRWKFGLLTSASFRYNSGIPFNALIPHFLYGDNEGFCGTLAGIGNVCNPRGTAVNPITGSNRTPNNYNLDLGAYYPINLGEDRQLRLQLDWFNVTNVQRAIRQDETFYINSGAPAASNINPQLNPFFGTGTIFQFPSALRLGIKFQF